MKPNHPARVAVVIDCWPDKVDEFVKLTESIRQQKLAPVYLRVRDFYNESETLVDPRIVEAVKNLRFFVGNVKAMSFSMEQADHGPTLSKVLDDLFLRREWDVLLMITNEVELAPDALQRISKRFLDPIDPPYYVQAKPRDIVLDGWWAKLWWTLRRRNRDVVAYRRDVVRFWHVGRIRE